MSARSSSWMMTPPALKPFTVFRCSPNRIWRQLEAELQNDLPAFYILTNSRSLTLPVARSLNTEIGRNLIEAGRRAKRAFVVVSRSDSTLRGHFPGEVEALAFGLGENFDGWIVIPFFLEGGRYTVGDTHYVDEGGWLVPSAETEFARDSVFGYRSSNLRDWVEEKTGNAFHPKTFSLSPSRMFGWEVRPKSQSG